MTTPPAVIIRRVRFNELSIHEFHALLWMRQSVLIVEQASPYPDIDGRDPDALHLIATRVQDGAPVGCARVFGPDPEKGGATAFGRLAVRPEERKTGLGRTLVAESLAELTERWPAHDVVIGAQLYLERFYGGFGFLRDSDVYDDVGIPHIDMRLRR